MSYNKYYESWFRGNNTISQGSGYSDNVSLRNDGKTELRGDTYINNNGRLMINKDKNSSTTYNLDVNGNSSFNGDIILNNKNILSKVQTISAATTLAFNSGEYVCISSSFPNNGQITLPLANSSSIGTKFTFFYGSTSTFPNVSIYANTGQTIADNTTGIDNTFINIDSNKPFTELVCVGSSGVCWAQSNGLYSYTEFGGIYQDNTWTGENYFLTALTSDNSTKVATTAYVKGNLSSYQTTAGMSSYALLVSPSFSGTPSVPTPLSSDNSTRIASTAYVKSNLSSYQLTSGMSSYALLVSPSFSGTPSVPTQLSSDNSTRIASTAYVKSNLSSYQLTSGMSSYALLVSPSFSGTPSVPTPLSSDNSTTIASTAYVKNNLANYVLQTYLDANYNTTAYMTNNFASLSNNNIFLGGGSFAGIMDFKNDVNIINSKALTITSGSNLTMDSGSNLYVNGGMVVTGLATFQSPNEPTLNSVRIANLDDIKFPQTPIYAPSFRSTTQSAGGLICGFQSENGDSRFEMYDEATGLTPNCAVIKTLAGNGIGIQAVYGTINNFIGTTLRTQVTSTGLSVTGNISFSGTLNSVSTTVFGYISSLTSSAQTQFNNLANGTTAFSTITLSNKYKLAQNSLITGNVTLSYYLNEIYSINVTTATTITLPTIAGANVGTKVRFRRTAGTTTVAISFIGNGSQSVFNSSNTGGTTAQALMPSGSYSVTLCALYQSSTSTFAWYQV